MIIDKNGNLISSDAYGGSAMDMGVSVRPSGNGIIIGANTMSFGNGGMDMMVFKHDLGSISSCNASTVKILSAAFSPKSTDMTSKVITENINESSSNKYPGKASTKIEKSKVSSNLLCQ